MSLGEREVRRTGAVGTTVEAVLKGLSNVIRDLEG